MDIRWMAATNVADIEAASHLFDEAVQAELTETFFAQPNHHLAIAYVADVPAGFVSGVEITHPDKPTEMFLYELGVDDAYRGQGVGKALVAALRDHAVERDCRGMWVLTDHDNEAALATYRAAGAGDPDPQVLLEWTF